MDHILAVRILTVTALKNAAQQTIGLVSDLRTMNKDMQRRRW